MTDLNIDAVADAVLPLDSPHTPDQISAAAAVFAELVRRLNHVTRSASLDYPSQVGAVVAHLRQGVAGLPQLCGQLAELLVGFGDTSGLYATSGGDPVRVVEVAVARLVRAGFGADTAAGALSEARDVIAVLRMTVREGEGEDG